MLSVAFIYSIRSKGRTGPDLCNIITLLFKSECFVRIVKKILIRYGLIQVAIEAINIIGENLPDEAAFLAERYLKRAERDHYSEQIRLSAGDSAQKPVQLDEESD